RHQPLPAGVCGARPPVPNGAHNKFKGVLILSGMAPELLPVEGRPDKALARGPVADDAVFRVGEHSPMNEVVVVLLLGSGHAGSLKGQVQTPSNDQCPHQHEDDDVPSPAHKGTTPFTRGPSRQSSSSAAPSSRSIH